MHHSLTFTSYHHIHYFTSSATTLPYFSLVRLWRDRADWDKLILKMLSCLMNDLDVELLEQELAKVCVMCIMFGVCSLCDVVER